MRICPGIYFADEAAGREAKVAGTGSGSEPSPDRPAWTYPAWTYMDAKYRLVPFSAG